MSVTGTWNLTLNSPLGDQSATLRLEDASGTLQGTLTGKAEPSPLQDLKAEGDNLSFSADADTPVGRLKLGFNGVATGDSFTGTYSTPFGAFNFSGSRA